MRPTLQDRKNAARLVAMRVVVASMKRDDEAYRDLLDEYFQGSDAELAHRASELVNTLVGLCQAIYEMATNSPEEALAVADDHRLIVEADLVGFDPSELL